MVEEVCPIKTTYPGSHPQPTSPAEPVFSDNRGVVFSTPRGETGQDHVILLQLAWWGRTAEPAVVLPTAVARQPVPQSRCQPALWK